MNCPSCSSELPDDAEFCAFCGSSILLCRACGHSYDEDARFCGNCGLSLQAGTAFSNSTGTDSKPAVKQTSPGHPGPKAEEGRPTFVLPSSDEENDPNVFGFLYDSDHPKHRHRLELGDNTLGAGHNNDIVIDKPAVSWNHALLICRNAKVFVQDSASTNGTFVNGSRVTHPRQLSHGDLLQFGNVEYAVWLKSRFRH